jgi:hypothetical protein
MTSFAPGTGDSSGREKPLMSCGIMTRRVRAKVKVEAREKILVEAREKILVEARKKILVEAREKILVEARKKARGKGVDNLHNYWKFL